MAARAIVAGARRFAYVAFANHDAGGPAFVLGRCDEGLSGFTLVDGIGFTEYGAADDFAAFRNAARGLTEADVDSIVLSTIGGWRGGEAS